MTDNYKKQKPIATSIRIPEELMAGIEKIMKRDMMDKTNVILQAIEYWVKHEGIIIDDDNLKEKVYHIEEIITDMQNTISKYEESISDLHKIIITQSNTIDKLTQNKK